jgi:hypothetical protein
VDQFGRSDVIQRSGLTHPEPQEREAAMREWLLVLVPIALVIYFLVYPDQFHAITNWLTH